MNKKQIYILLAILIFLAAGVLLKQWSRSPQLVTEDYSELSLALDEAAAAHIEVKRMGKELLALDLEKSGWVLPSRWKVPADAEKVRKFFKLISGARGELRSQDAALLGDYGLGDGSVFTILIKDAEDKVLLDLRVGSVRAADGQAFVQRADTAEVYLADFDFFNTFGIYGDAAQAEIKADLWADLQPLKFTVSDITALEVRCLEKGSGVPAASVKKSSGDKPVWEFAGPHGRFKIDPAKVEAFLGELENLRARAVVDPAGSYGFESPLLEIKLEGKNPLTLTVGKENADKSARYFKVSGLNFPYEISGYEAGNLLIDDSRFFSANPLALELPAVQAFTLYTQGAEKRIAFADGEVFTHLKNRFSDLKITGLLSAEESKGKISSPAREWIRIELGTPDKNITLDFGDKLAPDASGAEKRAVALRGENTAFTVTEFDYEDFFNAAKPEKPPVPHAKLS
ncbi:MAG: hypothetical protein A2Y02_00545 [Omnitrophica bacterium GWA2_52_12]|nr:MAG: hypothetical protein A2Y02_00545 [Omnitrophica bacterium GWA2_52_12]